MIKILIRKTFQNSYYKDNLLKRDFSFRKLSGDQSPPGRVELEDPALCHRVKQEEEEEEDEGGDRLDVVGGIEDSLIKGDYVIKLAHTKHIKNKAS